MTFLSDGDELLDFKHVRGSEIPCIAGFKLASVWMNRNKRLLCSEMYQGKAEMLTLI